MINRDIYSSNNNSWVGSLTSNNSQESECYSQTKKYHGFNTYFKKSQIEDLHSLIPVYFQADSDNQKYLNQNMSIQYENNNSSSQNSQSYLNSSIMGSEQPESYENNQYSPHPIQVSFSLNSELSLFSESQQYEIPFSQNHSQHIQQSYSNNISQQMSVQISIDNNSNSNYDYDYDTSLFSKSNNESDNNLFEAGKLVFLQNTQIQQNNNQCAICIQKLGQFTLLKLRCKHIFHYNCIEPWIQNSNTCPTCRCQL